MTQNSRGLGMAPELGAEAFETKKPTIQKPSAPENKGEGDLYVYNGKKCNEWNAILSYEAKDNDEISTVRSRTLYANEFKASNDAKFAAVCTILNIEPTFPIDEAVIRQAYRKLSMNFHPDKISQSGISNESATAVSQILTAARDMYFQLVTEKYDPNTPVQSVPPSGNAYTADFDKHNGFVEKMKKRWKNQAKADRAAESKTSKAQSDVPPANNPQSAADDPRLNVLELLKLEQSRLMDKYHLVSFDSEQKGNDITLLTKLTEDKNGNQFKQTKSTDTAMDRVKEIGILMAKLQTSLTRHPAKDDPSMSSDKIHNELITLRSKMQSTGTLGIIVTGRNNITKAMQCVMPSETAKPSLTEKIRTAFKR